MIIAEDTRLSVILEKTSQHHQHLCPKQVLGARMGIMAGELLNLPLPQTNSKRAFIFMETDGCTATGVSMATGCSVYRRTMRMMDYGKVAITCVDTHTNRAFRIRPDLNSRQRAQESQPDAQSRWHAYLYGYQQLPTSDLLNVTPVNLTINLQQIISNPNARTFCEQCGEEIMNQREIVNHDLILCNACAGNGYYYGAHDDR